ncbi:MAG TPA: S9 family peptidase [Croceibacterium sp.]|nr:S9 family peptidase [Croceibacterium sp.]
MFRSFLAAGAAACALLPAIALADTAEEVAAKLGSREFVRSIGLSPEGKQAVVVSPLKTGGETASVINFATGITTPILSSTGGDQSLDGCNFLLEERVVCAVLFNRGSTRDIDQATRLISLSPDGKDMKQLTAKSRMNTYYQSRYGGGIVDYNVAGDPKAILMQSWVAAERQTGSISSGTGEGLAVEKVNLLTLNRKTVLAPKENAIDYISDGYGNVRLMQTQHTDELGEATLTSSFFYRPKSGGGWKPLSTLVTTRGQIRGFNPVTVDSQADVAYGFDTNNGYNSLFKMSLDGSGKETLVLGSNVADIDSVIEIGRSQRLVGASYVTEKRHVEYLDPELKTLSAKLAKALGLDNEVSIIDSSADEQKLLILAGTDTQPGKFYVYDKGTSQLGLLLPARPELEGMQFGQMKPITYPAADGTKIPAYLTLPPGSDGKNLPAIVLPHGGPDARDVWGFDWLVQYFAVRGFAVLQPEYRGSSGYGNDWFKGNAFHSWKAAIDDINDAGRWLEKSGVAAPGKIAIFGWSYGGYAALESAVVDPDLFKAVVAVAPVTDLDALRAEHLGYDYKYVDAQIGNGPYIAEASPARHADRFKVPVLLVHGDTDTNVGVRESRLMNDRLKAAGKQVRYIEFKGLTHQLDDASARAQMLVAAEKTIRQGMGLN